VVELLLVDGQGHDLELWIFGKGHIPFLSGSKTIYSMDPHTPRVDVRYDKMMENDSHKDVNVGI